MDIKDLIESLPYETFNEVRKAVLIRHSTEAANSLKILMYLKNNKTVEEVKEADPNELIPHLMEVNECGPEVCIRTIGMFLAQTTEDDNGSGQTV